MTISTKNIDDQHGDDSFSKRRTQGPLSLKDDSSTLYQNIQTPEELYLNVIFYFSKGLPMPRTVTGGAEGIHRFAIMPASITAVEGMVSFVLPGCASVVLIPLNPLRVNAIARDLGLEVSRRV